MNNDTNQKADIDREIDALREILGVGIPGAPILSAYLEGVLAVLESGGEFPEALGITVAKVDTREKLLTKAGNKSKSGGLDSLGGGRIV